MPSGLALVASLESKKVSSNISGRAREKSAAVEEVCKGGKVSSPSMARPCLSWSSAGTAYSGKDASEDALRIAAPMDEMNVHSDRCPSLEADPDEGEGSIPCMTSTRAGAARLKKPKAVVRLLEDKSKGRRLPRPNRLNFLSQNGNGIH